MPPEIKFGFFVVQLFARCIAPIENSDKGHSLLVRRNKVFLTMTVKLVLALNLFQWDSRYFVAHF